MVWIHKTKKLFPQQEDVLISGESEFWRDVWYLFLLNEENIVADDRCSF